MALKIRLQRTGAAHKPIYRIVVAESASRRDGKFVETIGTYNPSPRGQEVLSKINIERADYWVSVGAKPTDTVKALIKKAKAESANA